MIAPAQFAAARRALPRWACGLVCLALLSVAADFGLRHVALTRAASDYRRPLAEAARMWDAPGFSPAAAKAAIDEAIRLAPDRPEPLVLLGHLRYRLGQWRDAIDTYEEAIALGTREKGIRQNVVWSYVELGNFDAAAQYGADALEAGFDGPLLHRYVGEAYYRASNLSAAREHFEAALERSSDDAHLMNRLLSIYLSQGDEDAAASIEARIFAAEARLGTVRNGAP